MSDFLPNEARRTLIALGERFRLARLARNESQDVLAQRLRISVPTLRAMERGNSSVQIGYWATALWALGRTEEMDAVCAEKRDLFAEADRERSIRDSVRKRACRGRTKHS